MLCKYAVHDLADSDFKFTSIVRISNARLPYLLQIDWLTKAGVLDVLTKDTTNWRRGFYKKNGDYTTSTGNCTR